MKIRTLAATFVAAAFACVSQAQVIDFQSLEHNDANIIYHGIQYDEDGFRLTKGQNEPFDFATFGTQESRYPGSTALFNDTVDGQIILTQIGGAPFNLLSIQIANLNNAGPVTVNFVGNLNGGGQVFDSYTTTGSSNVLETHNFDSSWSDLLSVEWVQEGPFHQFDNITVGAVPAPGAIALLGLAGLAARRRRRN